MHAFYVDIYQHTVKSSGFRVVIVRFRRETKATWFNLGIVRFERKIIKFDSSFTFEFKRKRGTIPFKNTHSKKKHYKEAA